AASRVCDERCGRKRRTALDPAPGTRPPECLSISLDNADAVIDAATARNDRNSGTPPTPVLLFRHFATIS
ncbi:MAG TPA: hypothetical protein VFZ08_13515, partial [Terriglobia bacterium]|nr:hypothetical protein [Terriglobia bacterium]